MSVRSAREIAKTVGSYHLNEVDCLSMARRDADVGPMDATARNYVGNVGGAHVGRSGSRHPVDVRADHVVSGERANPKGIAYGA